MADKKMNEFANSPSFSSIYAEDSSGNQNKVSKANLADELWGYNRESVISQDWDTLTIPGLYNVTNASGNNKPNSYMYGILEVNALGAIVLQRYYPDGTGQKCCYRTKYGSQGWRPWRYYAFG